MQEYGTHLNPGFHPGDHVAHPGARALAEGDGVVALRVRELSESALLRVGEAAGVDHPASEDRGHGKHGARARARRGGRRGLGCRGGSG
jgi:hypothetical protein